MCMFCMTDGVYDESGYVHTFIQNHTVYYIDCVYRTALAFLVNTIDHLSAERVGLPDENGRVEILQIHTAQMIKYKKLAEDVNIKELAKRTRNFSGAELEGLVRSAQSTAMNRLVQVIEFIYRWDCCYRLIQKEEYLSALPWFHSVTGWLGTFAPP